MGDSIINYLRTVIENNPDALPTFLVILLLFVVMQLLLHLILVSRVHRLEKLLKHNWPMKFVGKL